MQPICQELDEGSVSQQNLLKNWTKKYEEQILLNLGYDEKIKDIIMAKNPLFRRLDHCVETKGSDYISWHGTYQVKMRMMTEED